MWPFWHSVSSCSFDSASNKNSVRSSSGRQVSPAVVGSSPEWLIACPNPFLGLRQVAVHEHHGHRPFADGSRHAFGGVGTHISCNKHTGHTCFQMMWRSVESPADHVLQVRSGEHEPVVVTCDHAVQPVGARLCADEDEHPGASDLLGPAGSLILEDQLLDVVVAAHLPDHRAGPNVDVVDGL